MHIQLQIAGVGLDKKDTFGKSDPYYQIWQQDAVKDGGTDAGAGVGGAAGPKLPKR